MKPSAETLRRLCPEVDERLIAEHLSRLGEDYFKVFDVDAIAEHLRRLSKLSLRHPVELVLRDEGSRVECTVLAFDYPGEFSLITGVLSGAGFSILSGDVFTYAAAAPAAPPPHRRAEAGLELLRRRRIADHFSGTLVGAPSFDAWAADLERRMVEVILLLEAGDADSVRRAKHHVNERVARRLSAIQANGLPLLYPVQIEIENRRRRCTTLRVVSQDTPAFLYSLSSALSLRGATVEHVRIRTTRGRIEDEIDILDSRGKKITGREALNQIKLSVLLTKQFTYFLGRAPDPYAALCRFEQMVEDVLRLPERGQWMELLSRPRALQDLARVLGASDFIWEDMIRLQYETLLPMLGSQVEGRRFADPPGALKTRLEKAMAAAGTMEEKRRVLNEFKDHEIFLIDLDHILHPGSGPAALAEPLTKLAELVASAAAAAVYEDLARRHGRPRTVGGLETEYAILGLGKFGGAALGYASDIELLFVYSDNGRTDGPEPLENSEFFEKLVRQTAGLIVAKREGIFHVDVRLRPYGVSGPWACSLENFCRYYGPGGPALSYERLALVRLRAVGGDPELGRQIERLRDSFVYDAEGIRIRELRELREKQIHEKVRDRRYNAKFSPGALVDLEYDVQILQILHGKEHPDLRTPRIHEALAALSRAGVLTAEESRQMTGAYDFLRRLVNGLRMLRGSAADLFLPARGSDEFAHLARRMGYERGGSLEPEQQLYLEFETQTALVRAFIERHFGRESLPGPATRNVADLVLSRNVPLELRQRVLRETGFGDAERAFRNLLALAGEEGRREVFARLALLACDTLQQMPDLDMALNNWERFVHALPDAAAHYQTVLSQPRRLEILMGVFSGSQFLSDTLVRNPEFFDWVTNPENLQTVRSAGTIRQDLLTFSAAAASHAEWLNALRSFRRREVLRIGIRDIGLKVPFEEVVTELSSLAEVLTDAALEREWLRIKAEGRTSPVRNPKRHLCILALGKLGGAELNYSSDIDLLALCDDKARAVGAGEDPGARDVFEYVMEQVVNALSAHTEEGYAYRVDMRLRPYGRASRLCGAVSELADYYGRKAALWEIQALLKARPIAGHRATGEAFLSGVRETLLCRRRPEDIVRSIEGMRGKAVQSVRSRLLTGTDVKSGLGGLRDIEFLVQGLQLIHAPDHPELIQGNTLLALNGLKGAGILREDVVSRLAADYIFLRRIEHHLQILEDRQIHSLPEEPAQLLALARRVLGAGADSVQLMKRLNECQKRVRGLYTRFLLEDDA